MKRLKRRAADGKVLGIREFLSGTLCRKEQVKVKHGREKSKKHLKSKIGNPKGKSKNPAEAKYTARGSFNQNFWRISNRSPTKKREPERGKKDGL